MNLKDKGGLSVKITNNKPTGEIEVKRFYLDGVVVTGECPKCGNPVELDLGGDQYLSYPPMNRPFKETLMCFECDEEVEVTLQLNVSVQIKNKGEVIMFKCIPSSEGNVWKYIFEKEDAIAEAVLYKYGSFIERTVICCSVQSGCSVGCTFCGTGKNFIRNLTSEEIVEQITTILKDKDIENINSSGKRFQIMFMSMGEPMLNWDNVERAIMTLHRMYPNAELLISTMGIDDDITFGRIIELSEHIDKIGLQFSIHKSNDLERNDLIPFKKKMRLSKIRDAGLVWWHRTGRKPYLNYCVDGTNNDYGDHVLLETLFSPAVFNFTFSVVCSADETMKEAGFRKHEAIQDFMRYFNERGYNTRMFDPAGQDDIGGGCGQLWYVQDWMRDYKKGDK